MPKLLGVRNIAVALWNRDGFSDSSGTFYEHESVASEVHYHFPGLKKLSFVFDDGMGKVRNRNLVVMKRECAVSDSERLMVEALDGWRGMYRQG